MYTLALLSLILVSTLFADPLASLSKDDRAAIAMLGNGVILDTVKTDPVVQATDWLPLRPSSLTFVRTTGPKAGQTETISIISTTRAPGSPVGSKKGGWSEKDPELWTRYLDVSNGNIRVPSSLNVPEAVVSKYEPADPLILAGVKPGQAVTQRVSVKVYDVGDPTTVAHSGTLDSVYRDLGGFKLAVPAGTFNTRLIKTTYNGKIGPANVAYAAWVFYAKDVGPVAFSGHRDVTAFLINNDAQRFGAVLRSNGAGKTKTDSAGN